MPCAMTGRWLWQWEIVWFLYEWKQDEERHWSHDEIWDEFLGRYNIVLHEDYDYVDTEQGRWIMVGRNHICDYLVQERCRWVIKKQRAIKLSDESRKIKPNRMLHATGYRRPRYRRRT